MDALSSQSTIAGYKAVVAAADRLPRLFPLLMTAAGTVAPAKVLVLGAGVAGLQAIATARRLGAVVSGFDVRPAVREQVESLGASFLDLGIQGAETSGGYAAELTPEEQARQQEALEERIPEYDVVVTTALVPGRPAPKLIPATAVEKMRPGSVIVDLAAETGGNCELTEPGTEVEGTASRSSASPTSPRARLTTLASSTRATSPRSSSTWRRAASSRSTSTTRSPAAPASRARESPHRGGKGPGVSLILVFELTILVLAIFLGVEVISKVPTMLHTPLMSGTNAIHGIVLVGAILVAGRAGADTLTLVIGFCAVVLGTANVVGGFVVTDRMLEMFKQRRPAKPKPE